LAAGGIGTRLRPLTDVLPKCLVPINGRPLLGIWLDMLAGSGATEIVVNLHHHAALVRDYLSRSPHADLITPVFEPELLGTGGTLRENRQRFVGAPFLFAHADNLSCFDPSQLMAAHRARPSGTVMTMMTFKTENPRQCGIVEQDARAVVVGFHEKSAHPPGDLANAAVLVMDDDVLNFIDALGRRFVEFSTDVIPHFAGRIATFHNAVYHRDIGTPASLLRAQFDYPLVAAGCSGAIDPWFGLMRENDGSLGRALTDAIATMLPP
jgi:mannose-1-phosphate guanylyltransferase